MMEKLEMKTARVSQENIEKIRALFPNAVTEVKKDGRVELAVDFDVLKQELSDTVIEAGQERYQMTWPDKRKAVALANSAISATLRPCKEESVDFDTTENLYIEGDNLDVLKLLRETYLGKVKMIYIDPPYNTGNDFVYEDDFAQSAEEYTANSGQYDEQGNRLFQNTESNGRFHTDWLNMIYPRLKVARDLLTDDGVIFISIDDNEQANLKKVCDEIFGESNFVACISNINNPKGRSDDQFVATSNEFISIYAKSITSLTWNGFEPTEVITKRYNKVDENGDKYREIDLRKTGENDLREDRPNLFYYFYYNPDRKDLFVSREDRCFNGYIQIVPLREDGQEGNWRWGIDNAKENIEKLIPKFMPKRKIWGIMEKDYLKSREFVKPTTSWDFKDVNSERGTEEFISLNFDKRVFPKPKPIGTIKRCLKLATNINSIILDFFSGSATTAHAVMQLNAEDGGKRKFIMVQLPEKCDEKSEAYKAGYKNICEIGKERIRRAGRKILADKQRYSENGLLALTEDIKKEGLFEATDNLKARTNKTDLDVGFRVLKLDSSNMQDVFYNPSAMTQSLLDSTVDNVKPDRTPLDLLFQVMLELGKPLSAKIEEREVDGKKYYAVDGNDLIACFDDDLGNEVITAIAKQKPLYAVFKDKSFATDSVGINNEQLFKTYSPATVVKVI